jgi:HD-GYP domain-containing protein (c-di-GMP phosphodiesterase class II)
MAIGDRMEHGLRSAYVGLRLADALGLPEADREAVFYGALLKDTGCSSCGTVVAAFFPDRRLPDLDLMMSDRSGLQRLTALLTRHVPLDAALPGRVARFLSFVVNCQPILRESVAAHCEVAELFARRLGFPERVQRAVRFQWERWDGKGVAYGMQREEIPPPARVLHLAQMVEFVHGLGGPAAAEALARERSAARFDPSVVGGFLGLAGQPGFWQVLDDPEMQEAIVSMAPVTEADRATRDHTDAVCEALADLADSKAPGTRDHSRTVAAVAVDIGHQLRLDPKEQTVLRRAALVHDLGRVALPSGLLESGRRYSAAEWEQVRLHPHYTNLVLDRVAQLRELAEIASAHHEQLDGNGYHRQLAAHQIPAGARILAVADRYAEARGRGEEPEPALAGLRAVAGTELDASCYDALVRSLGAQDHARPVPRRARAPLGLSEREVEVLRLLAGGMSNPEIAGALVISRKTVEHHVEHIFNKLGVTSRTAAAAVAVHSGVG